MKKNGTKETLVLISPDGRTLGPAAADMPPRDDYLGPAKAAEVTFKCGHKGQAFYALSVYGRMVVVSGLQATDHALCPDCLVKKELKGLTRCGVCGGPIIPDTRVAVYRDAPGIIDDAKRFDYKGQKCVMGCARCAPDGVQPVGKWDGERFVPEDRLVSGGMMELLELLGQGGQLPHLGDPELCTACDAENCRDRKAPYMGASDRAITDGRNHAG